MCARQGNKKKMCPRFSHRRNTKRVNRRRTQLALLNDGKENIIVCRGNEGIMNFCENALNKGIDSSVSLNALNCLCCGYLHNICRRALLVFAHQPYSMMQHNHADAEPRGNYSSSPALCVRALMLCTRFLHCINNTVFREKLHKQK